MSVRVALMHGFGVEDKGRKTFGQVPDNLRREGIDAYLLPWRETTLFNVRECTEAGVNILLEDNPDVLVAHSHANVIAHKALFEGFSPKFIVVYQPAMRRSQRWPDEQHGLVWYNERDFAVRWGKAWRFMAFPWWGNPWSWGTAAAHGFEDPGANIRQTKWGKGHSYLSDSPWQELSTGVIKSIVEKTERGDYDES